MIKLKNISRSNFLVAPGVSLLPGHCLEIVNDKLAKIAEKLHKHYPNEFVLLDDERKAVVSTPVEPPVPQGVVDSPKEDASEKKKKR